MMRQMLLEGWIPHLARQAVGCFLTRGALWICWEEGFKVCVNENYAVDSNNELLLTFPWLVPTLGFEL